MLIFIEQIVFFPTMSEIQADFVPIISKENQTGNLEKSFFYLIFAKNKRHDTNSKISDFRNTRALRN